MLHNLLLIALLQTAAPAPVADFAPLPPGAFLIMSDDGRPKKCKPGPTDVADRAFKDACRAFIRDAGQTRAGLPDGDTSRWVEWSDAPPGAAAVREKGSSVVRVGVGIDGKPQSCETVRSSGFADLDAAACAAMMKRARFKPAIGWDGMPYAFLYTRSVNW